MRSASNNWRWQSFGIPLRSGSSSFQWGGRYCARDLLLGLLGSWGLVECRACPANGKTPLLVLSPNLISSPYCPSPPTAQTHHPTPAAGNSWQIGRFLVTRSCRGRWSRHILRGQPDWDQWWHRRLQWRFIVSWDSEEVNWQGNHWLNFGEIRWVDLSWERDDDRLRCVARTIGWYSYIIDPLDAYLFIKRHSKAKHHLHIQVLPKWVKDKGGITLNTYNKSIVAWNMWSEGILKDTVVLVRTCQCQLDGSLMWSLSTKKWGDMIVPLLLWRHASKKWLN